MAARPPRVLIFGTYDKVAHPRVQIVIDGLRSRGLSVEECNEPLGVGTDTRIGLVQRPWGLLGFGARVLSRWLALWRRAGAMGAFDAVIVAYMGHFDIHLARLRFRATPIVFDYFISGADTARDRRIGGPLVNRVLEAVDRAALAAAEVVMVETEEYVELVPGPIRPHAVVVPTGALDSWAAPPRPSYDGTRPLRVVFFGLFTPLQGTVTIARALAMLAGDSRIEVCMVGAGQELAAARRLAAPNRAVEWRGMVPFADMPALAARFDVCLGIFGQSPKALRVVPNKVYQGIRAGCAIVTSDTVPQRRALGEIAEYVPPGDPAALASTLRRLAADPDRVAAMQLGSRAAAERFSPPSVVAGLADLLHDPPLRRRRRLLSRRRS